MGIEELIIQIAEEKGLEKGLRKGLKKGRVETEKEIKTIAARNMLCEGLEIPLICKILDVSKKFVHSIQKEMESRENGY